MSSNLPVLQSRTQATMGRDLSELPQLAEVSLVSSGGDFLGGRLFSRDDLHLDSYPAAT